MIIWKLLGGVGTPFLLLFGSMYTPKFLWVKDQWGKRKPPQLVYTGTAFTGFNAAAVILELYLRKKLTVDNFLWDFLIFMIGTGIGIFSVPILGNLLLYWRHRNDVAYVHPAGTQYPEGSMWATPVVAQYVDPLVANAEPDNPELAGTDNSRWLP